MKSYIVSLHEDKGDKFKMSFQCWADDEDHAEEQALNAYPCGEVVHISLETIGWGGYIPLMLPYNNWRR